MHRRRFLQTSLALGATLSVAPTVHAAELAAGTQALVSTDALNVRGGPGIDEPVVTTLPGGARVDLLASSADGEWWRVAGDSAVGYVSASLLEPTGEALRNRAFDLDLSVPYSRQLTDVWCEAADIEMWMHYRQGSSGGPSRATQAAIWDWELAHNAGFSVDQWNCSPYATASAANRFMPDVGFDHFTYDDGLAGSRTLAWLLASPAYREPSIALVWRGLHYILVRGVRARGDPAQDANAELLGFYVSDPFVGASFWLGSDRFVPIERWLNELFVPISYLTPHTGVPGDVWQERMVAVQRAPSGSGPTMRGQRNATPAHYG